ncbi:MAG: cyclic nucleotide-binding domain-containing protein [Syntrophobacteria bacterium]
MIIEQADLFRGMSKDFVKQVFDITIKESLDEGDVLFREGDHARHFYILLKGRIRLSTGETGQLAHTISRGGEAFGWSSLVDRDVYSASAECIVPTKLIKIDREEFEKVVEKDLANAVIFYKRLAGAVGERLINSYHALRLIQTSEAHLSDR